LFNDQNNILEEKDDEFDMINSMNSSIIVNSNNISSNSVKINTNYKTPNNNLSNLNNSNSINYNNSINDLDISTDSLSNRIKV